MDQQDAGEEGSAAESGRVLVREFLITPLCRAGLRRGRGQSQKALDDSLAHMAGCLDHMTPDNLRTLADVVIDHATAPGPLQGVWPSEILLLAWARALQPRPIGERPIVTSWLKSVEGPRAVAGGYLIELRRFLLRHGRPPLAMDMRQIHEAAAEANREAALIRGRIARDCATDHDRDWLEARGRDEQTALAAVEAGIAHRLVGAL